MIYEIILFFSQLLTIYEINRKKLRLPSGLTIDLCLLCLIYADETRTFFYLITFYFKEKFDKYTLLSSKCTCKRSQTLYANIVSTQKFVQVHSFQITITPRLFSLNFEIPKLYSHFRSAKQFEFVIQM